MKSLLGALLGRVELDWRQLAVDSQLLSRDTITEVTIRDCTHHHDLVSYKSDVGIYEINCPTFDPSVFITAKLVSIELAVFTPCAGVDEEFSLPCSR